MRRRTHSLRVPAAVPGILPRLVVVVLVTVGVLTTLPFPLWQVIGIVASAVAVVAPRMLTAWIGALVIPFGVLLTPPSPAETALAMLLVHAIHVLASVSLVVPAWSWFSLRALRPGLGRLVVVQLIAQPIGFGVPLLTSGWSQPGLGWLAPAAAAALLLGLTLMLRALKRADTAESGPAPSTAETPEVRQGA